MNIRRVLLGVAAVLAVALMAACGGSEGTETATPAPAAAPSATAQSLATPTSVPTGAAALPTLAPAGTPARAFDFQGTVAPSQAGTAGWCQAGASWSYTGVTPGTAGGQSTGTVAGFEEFKGKTYCRADMTVESSGVRAVYTYYYNEGSDDIWVIMNIGGQVSEYHYGGTGSTASDATAVSSPVGIVDSGTPGAGDGSSDAPVDDWCQAGASWSYGAAGPGTTGTSSGTIVGLEEYKGKEYCKAEIKNEAEGTTILTTYYFNQDSSDLWMITNVGGQTQEIHFGS